MDFRGRVVNGCKQGEPQAESELSTQQLLGLATADGFSVSEQKLRRWTRLGLFPRSRRPGLGRGGGRSSGMYPYSAGPHLLALCQLNKRLRGSKAVGWELWWSGFPVHERFWLAPLRKTAENWDRHIEVAKPQIGSGRRVDASEEALDALYSFSRGQLNDAPFRQVRKRLKAAKFDSFMLSMIRIGIGSFDATVEWDPPEEREPEQEDLRVGFGLSRIKPDEIRERLGLPPADYDVDTALELLSRRLKAKSAAQELRRLSEAEIASARDELRALRSLIAAEVDLMRSEIGKRASSLNTLKDFTQGDRKLTLLHLVIWICVGPDSELRTGARDVLARRPSTLGESSQPPQPL